MAADDSPPLRALLEVWCDRDRVLWQQCEGNNQQELYPPEAVVIDKVHLIAMRRCSPSDERYRHVLPPLLQHLQGSSTSPGISTGEPLTGRRRRAQDGSAKAKEHARIQRRASELLQTFEVQLEDRAPPWQPPPGIPPRPSKRPRLE